MMSISLLAQPAVQSHSAQIPFQIGASGAFDKLMLFSSGDIEFNTDFFSGRDDRNSVTAIEYGSMGSVCRNNRSKQRSYGDQGLHGSASFIEVRDA